VPISANSCLAPSPSLKSPIKNPKSKMHSAFRSLSPLTLLTPVKKFRDPQPSTILECCTWDRNVAPRRRDVAPGKRRKPLILLVCSNVAPGNAIFRRGPGGKLSDSQLSTLNYLRNFTARQKYYHGKVFCSKSTEFLKNHDFKTLPR
jgi:hypothetical protein